jgi:Carbohydrate/starch-binding module (family 21)
MSQMVKLKYGESVSFDPGGGVGVVYQTQMAARVVNTAFVKDVEVHYIQPDGSWAESPLTWQNNFGAYDLFALAQSSFATTHFAIRYTAAGVTYWDNNNEANYSVSEIAPNTINGNITLVSAKAVQGGPVQSSAQGSIYVRNLSYHKRVGIRVSADGWKSFTDVDATYGGLVSIAEGLSQIETWNFATPMFDFPGYGFGSFLFAAYYNDLDTGQWYWDSGLGDNYTLSWLDGGAVE